MSEFSVLLDALAALAWPILAAVALALLLPSIKRILESRRFTLKYGDAELSVQDASDQLRKQIQSLQDEVMALKSQAPSGSFQQEITMPLAAAPGAAASELAGEAGAMPAPENRQILWVDDKPANNAFEIAKLQDDGFQVMQARSTDEAMQKISEGLRPRVVISDMGRYENGHYVSKAGLELIKRLRQEGVEAPVYIYTSKKYAQAHHDAALEAGGNGATASPVALFQMIQRSMS